MDLLFANQTTFLSIVNYLYSPSNTAYMSAPRRHLEPSRGAGAGLGGRHGLGGAGQEQARRGLQRHHQETWRQVCHQEMLIM